MSSDKRKKSQRPITIYDVAEESGVSYSTVSRVLNGFEYVKESTREKVLSTAQRLGYVANIKARSLAGGRSNVIGLLVPALDNNYVSEIIRGIDEELAKADYDLMLYTTHHRHGKESRYVTTIANGPADGLILVVPLIPAQYMQMLHDQQFPYVLIDQSEASGKSAVIDTTNRQGAHELVSYLIELGHRRIAIITGILEIASAQERLESYKAALADHHIPLEKQLIVEGNFDEETGFQAMQKLLNLPAADRPTAVFASNDLMAIGAMDAIREAGLDVPQDISVVGFDDIPLASHVHPKLTTVRQPLEQMGRLAVKLLLEQIENEGHEPRRVTLDTELVVRESCRRI